MGLGAVQLIVIDVFDIDLKAIVNHPSLAYLELGKFYATTISVQFRRIITHLPSTATSNSPQLARLVDSAGVELCAQMQL